VRFHIYCTDSSLAMSVSNVGLNFSFDRQTRGGDAKFRPSAKNLPARRALTGGQALRHWHGSGASD
jgi:hypothetical protein